MTKTWLAIGGGAAVVAAAIVIAIAVRGTGEHVGTPRGDDRRVETPPARDPLVEEFRAVERASLAAYNGALRDQRENRIDELELANVIERDVLEPWRALRQRIEAAPIPSGGDELYRALRRYLELRQISWEAYVTALRAPSDEAARPHLDAHRQKNSEAQDEAHHLAQLFRALE